MVCLMSELGHFVDLACTPHVRSEGYSGNPTVWRASLVAEIEERAKSAEGKLRQPYKESAQANVNFIEPIQQVLPDGQITSCFPKWLVQPLLQKYFRFRLTQIRCISRTSRPTRGAIARRHERGAGCGGRGSVRRCQGMAGRVDRPVS
jgi:hypothetical protein